MPELKGRQAGQEVSIPSHQGCGGKLKKLTETPVEAGEPGNSYIVFVCQKCGGTVLVGGK